MYVGQSYPLQRNFFQSFTDYFKIEGNYHKCCVFRKLCFESFCPLKKCQFNFIIFNLFFRMYFIFIADLPYHFRMYFINYILQCIKGERATFQKEAPAVDLQSKMDSIVKGFDMTFGHMRKMSFATMHFVAILLAFEYSQLFSFLTHFNLVLHLLQNPATFFDQQTKWLFSNSIVG